VWWVVLLKKTGAEDIDGDMQYLEIVWEEGLSGRVRERE